MYHLFALSGSEQIITSQGGRFIDAIICYAGFLVPKYQNPFALTQIEICDSKKKGRLFSCTKKQLHLSLFISQHHILPQACFLLVDMLHATQQMEYHSAVCDFQ